MFWLARESCQRVTGFICTRQIVKTDVLFTPGDGDGRGGRRAGGVRESWT
jgi:hypothetical protein